MTLESLQLRRLEGILYYVRDLERSRKFYTGMLDFTETWRSGSAYQQLSGETSACFSAGDVHVICSSPTQQTGRAARFLAKHPDGIGALVFEVLDIDRTFALLEQRGATPVDDIQTFDTPRGPVSSFSITTPFGDCLFCFRQHGGAAPPFAGADLVAEPAANRFGFQAIDHVTSNFLTMKPALLWLEHVMGFEQMWQVHFHTRDVELPPPRQSPSDAAEQFPTPDSGKPTGSGLRSVVMWDPQSGVKFANNEPARPNFWTSQINLFNEDLRGDGVQHVALTVSDIVGAVSGLRANGVCFMPTPDAYYDMLPDRLARGGVGRIEEDVATLRNLGILVDGDKPGTYLLQIFLKESAGLYGDASAGPFFFEVIERKGDRGFGAGNFRALFESIERLQRGGGKP